MWTNKKGLSQDTAHLGHCQAETGEDSDETQACFFLTDFELQEKTRSQQQMLLWCLGQHWLSDTGGIPEDF